MSNVKRIYGPPGCGKTETLMRTVDEALSSGVHPLSIAFVSFSKKAVAEGKERAQARFGLSDKDLKYFKTLHAMAFMELGLRRSDVMTSADYAEVGRLVGEQMSVAVTPDDGVLIPVDLKRGSKYLAIYDLSRYRMVSLEEEWDRHETYDMSIAKARQIRDQIEEYKTANGKVDFVDMIEQYVSRVLPPARRLLIVDEAQDLTPLQFAMVRKMAAYSERTVTAGDDDQCIHAWTGATSRDFIEFGDEEEILTQSYRLPRRVFDVANRIVHKIQDRIPKDYRPTDTEGTVTHHWSIDALPLDEGSWTIMGRTNRIVERLASQVRSMGYYYSIKGRAPLTEDQANGIHLWRTLVSGGSVSVSEAERLYDLLPKQGDKAVLRRGAKKLLESADPEAPLYLDDLIEFYGMKPMQASFFDDGHRDAFDVLGLGDEMRQYIKHVEGSGEDILQPPRIKLSTFHAMKGGEDDNCAVYLGTTYACAVLSPQDDEHRAFYVGVTRARHNLHIIEADHKDKYRYEI